MFFLLRAMLAYLLLTPALQAQATACQATNATPLILEYCMQAATAPAGSPPGLIWHRIRATPAAPNALLDIGLPDAYALVVLQRQGNDWHTLAKLDEHSRYRDRPLRHRKLIVPLAATDGPVELLVGFRTHGTTPLAPRLLTREQLIDDDTRADLANGIIFGIMLVQVPLLAVGLGTHQNNSYRIYAGLVLTSVLFIAQTEGYGLQFLWPDSPAWNMAIPEILALLMMGWHGAFAISLLQMRWRMPRLYRLNRVLIAAAALCAMVHLMYPATLWTLALTSAYGVLAVASAGEGVRQNVPAARFYLLGVLSLCSCSLVMTGLSMLWSNPFPGVPVLTFPKFGYLGETFFFGAAVLNQLRLQNEERAALRLQRLAENEQLLHAEQTRFAAMAEAERHKLRLASTSHDIAQPLASIRYAIAALHQRQDSMPIAAHIDNTLNYAQTLLNDMMTQCRREASGPELIELDELFARLEQEFSAAARHKGLRLRVHPPSWQVSGSALLLYRILSNLLANAIRYTPQGTVLLGARRRDGGIELQLWDTGPGIAPAMQRTLMAPWRQGEPGGQGFGLGLFIVRSLCEQCGYELVIHSTPGRGTGFCIRLPA
ncbi:MAG: sensor histidine kinase [Burkholderiaceae bacterium]|nr:sensor histidine kinase [Burkholderiaceae bacterium]